MQRKSFSGAVIQDRGSKIKSKAIPVTGLAGL
jgi:hypothetical protein